MEFEAEAVLFLLGAFLLRCLAIERKYMAKLLRH